MAARIVEAFEVVLGAQAEVERTDCVSVRSIGTIDYLADGLYRALLDEDIEQEWGSAVPLCCHDYASHELSPSLACLVNSHFCRQFRCRSQKWMLFKQDSFLPFPCFCL